jgi:hypothetical protein
MVNAPELVPVLDVVLVIDITALVLAPRPVTDCKVLVFHIVKLPVLVVTAVSVPALMLVAANSLMVAVVTN